MSEKATLISNKNPELISKLKEVYCDEWTAYFQYITHSRIIRGNLRPNIEAEFITHAEQEFGHSQSIADRLIQLNEFPVDDFRKFSSYTPNPILILEKPFNVKDSLNLNLSSEQTAIIKYNNILNLCKELDDKVTYDLIVDILSDEVEHEQDITNYILDLN